jgi:hypothetical protein
MDHKRQHWIPQSYLSAWADPAAPVDHEPWVWQFTKDGKTSKRKPPRKIFFENELYTLTLHDGGRDLSVEHGLAGLESCFARIRQQKLSQRLLLDDEDLYVRAFVAAMQSRTPGQLEHWRSNWRRMAEMGRRVQAAVDKGASWPIGVSSGGPSFSQEQVEQLASAELGAFVFPMIEAQLSDLRRMNLTVLETEDPLGLITSDAPCVWADPQMESWPPHMRNPGLAKESIEISLPISPSQLVLLTWRVPPGHASISQRGLDEVNRRPVGMPKNISWLVSRAQERSGSSRAHRMKANKPP